MFQTDLIVHYQES